jgi:hypothetical protein
MRGYVTWLTIWSLVWPILILAVGVLLLLNNLGIAEVDLLRLVGEWWPLLLIGLGLIMLIGAIWPRARHATESLSVELGRATAGDVRLRFGAGRLRIGPAAAGMLVDGSFRGGVAVKDRSDGRITLEPESAGGWWWGGQRLDWRVGLSAEVPLDLRVESGASSADLDLTSLQVGALRLQTGASEMTVRLPASAGLTRVKAESGAASLTLEVPDGVAARIRSKMVLGSTSISDRFPRDGDVHASPGYEAADNRVEIEVDGGVGSLTIR